MRPVPILLMSIVALGCGGRSREPATTSKVTQTTEITSALAPASPTGLDTRHIRERVAGRLAELVDRCGELQVATDRYETALHLEIDPSGSVQMADARGSHTRLDACIAEVARTWTFDPAGARTITNVPLVLERPSVPSGQ